MITRFLVAAALLCTAMFSNPLTINAQTATHPTSFIPSDNGIPSSLGGYEVLGVMTEYNLPCMPSGRTILSIRVPEPSVEKLTNSAESVIDKVEKDLVALGVKDVTNYGYEVGGPGITYESVQNNLAKIAEMQNQQLKATGKCPVLDTISYDAQEINHNQPLVPQNGYAGATNQNAGASNNNAQSLYLYAPSNVGTNQTVFSAFLNNVKNDAGKEEQNGFIFYQSGAPALVWTDSYYGLVARQYANLAYVYGATYWTTLTYTSNTWQMCIYNISDPNSYTCMLVSQEEGTHLVTDSNTAVFFENANTNADWYSGFSQYVRASAFMNYLSGNYSYLTSSYRFTAHNCVNSYNPNNAVNGTAVSGGVVYFNLNYLPLNCRHI